MEFSLMSDKPWKFSHTQLSLWKLCKRKYYHYYVLNQKEPTTPNMSAGTFLCQEPIEAWHQERAINDAFWESVWAGFLAEFGGDNSYDDPIFTLDLAKRILAAYKASPVQGKVVEIERTYEKEFPGGYVYISRPDFVVETEWTNHNPVTREWQEVYRTTWDIKLKTFNQARAGDTFFASSPLSPFDDQCLGQAILSGADAFGQIQFFVGKKDGLLVGPVYVEQPVNPVLAAEWNWETEAVCSEIEEWRQGHWHTTPWPKNDASCHAFGRDCHCLASCQFGFEVNHANS